MFKNIKRLFVAVIVNTTQRTVKEKYKTKKPEDYQKGYQVGEIMKNKPRSKAFREGMKHAQQGKHSKVEITEAYERLQVLRKQCLEQQKELEKKLDMER